MSDCPGTVGKIAFHCPGCRENAQLRAHLAQAKVVLEAWLERVREGDEGVAPTDLIVSTQLALADLPEGGVRRCSICHERPCPVPEKHGLNAGPDLPDA